MKLIVNYRLDPTVAAALLPAHFRPRLVSGHAVAGLLLDDEKTEYRLAVESGAYLLNSESGPLLSEELSRQVYASFRGEETVDVSVRPAHAWRSDLFGDAHAAARFAGMIAAVPVRIDWVRSTYFARLGGTADCALLVPDVPMSMDLAA
ncbi:hypothetical protein OJ997_02655 [Solirubrobacter phytolaccae]|uniref:Uncharacterized protein n=1 Tax=Solirubrobacter phytolaccae TaxID=1404360 RepID=A0A9X3N3S8_9ACTN|nr:hypothetical protein [Solirubrobacter phytolaccae]MDA0179183.1 hypothetical protein [Solirubrobacter phytolaccae]